MSGKMRELARLLIQARQMSNVRNLEDLLAPANFNFCIKAVKLLAGFEEVTHKYGNSSLAMGVGFSLKKCAQILHCEGLMEDNPTKTKNGEVFLELYNSMWQDLVSARAHQDMDLAKVNPVKLLPLCKDVQTLYIYVRRRSSELRSDGVTAESYAGFVRYTQCEMIMFNRKRGGEVQRMKLTDVTSTLLQSSAA